MGKREDLLYYRGRLEHHQDRIKEIKKRIAELDDKPPKEFKDDVCPLPNGATISLTIEDGEHKAIAAFDLTKEATQGKNFVRVSGEIGQLVASALSFDLANFKTDEFRKKEEDNGRG